MTSQHWTVFQTKEKGPQFSPSTGSLWPTIGPECLRRYQQDKRIGRRRLQLFLRPTDDRQPLLHDMVHLAKGHRLWNMTQDEILRWLNKSYKHVSIQMSAQTRMMCSWWNQKKKKNKNWSFQKYSKTWTQQKHQNSSQLKTLKKDINFSTQLSFAHHNDFQNIHNNRPATFCWDIKNHNSDHHQPFPVWSCSDGITFILTRQFYQVLVNTLDLQYENILLAASTAEQMQAVIWNKWPFFTNYTNVVEKCLRESNCDTLQEVYQDHGKDFSSSFFSIHILQMPTTSSESCPSTRST